MTRKAAAWVFAETPPSSGTPSSRRPSKPTGPLEFTLEQWARLAAAALDDAGLSATDVDGICTGHVQESQIFVPSTVIEYLGV